MTDRLPVAEGPMASRVAAATRRVAFHTVNVGYRVRNQLVWLGRAAGLRRSRSSAPFRPSCVTTAGSCGA